MFSGIIEAKSEILEFSLRGSVYELKLLRPPQFDDLKRGDSVAINGVCLTVETLTPEYVTFAVGPETLKITGWSSCNPLTGPVNCERSLRFGDRVHGHLVTGHVDALARVAKTERLDSSLIFEIEIPGPLAPLVWRKGSATLNGVSLTVNEVQGNRASFCLIPETLRLTNLSEIEEGSWLNIEADNLARGLLRLKETESEHHT